MCPPINTRELCLESFITVIKLQFLNPEKTGFGDLVSHGFGPDLGLGGQWGNRRERGLRLRDSDKRSIVVSISVVETQNIFGSTMNYFFVGRVTPQYFRS